MSESYKYEFGEDFDKEVAEIRALSPAQKAKLIKAVEENVCRIYEKRYNWGRSSSTEEESNGKIDLEAIEEDLEAILKFSTIEYGIEEDSDVLNFDCEEIEYWHCWGCNQNIGDNAPIIHIFIHHKDLFL